MDTTDIFGLLYKTIVLNIIGDNSHIKDDSFTSQLGTGNILGTLQSGSYSAGDLKGSCANDRSLRCSSSDRYI